MGQTENKDSSKNDSVNITHPNFGNAKFVPKGQNQSLIEISMSNEEKEYNEWKTHLDQYKMNSEFLLLPSNHQFSSKGLCGNSGTTKIQYPGYPYLLMEQINSRKKRNSVFEEQSIWYLLFAISSAKKDFKPVQSKVGDIRPHNIFVKHDRAVKLSNLHSWPRELTNYGKSFEGENTYLAPEELKDLEINKIESDKHQNAEVFSAGLTLLSTVNLEDYQSLYNLKSFTFDYSKLDSEKARFFANPAYSDILKATISSMLVTNPLDRTTFEQITEWIAPHETSIRSHVNFIFMNAPRTVERQVLKLRQINRPISSSFQQTSSLPRNSAQKFNFKYSSPINSSYEKGINISNQAESVYIPMNQMSMKKEEAENK